jgi:hypothetical protein
MYHAVAPGYIVTGVDWGKGFSAGVGGCDDFHFFLGLGFEKTHPLPLSLKEREGMRAWRD